MPRGHYQHKRRSPADRFWEKVARADSSACWAWNGSRVGRGYGQFWDGDRLIVAHRWLYEHLNGPVPGDIDICHSCDNPSCCNPDHLFAGSRAENMQDCSRKGRTVGQVSPDKLTRGLSHYTHTKPHLRLRGGRHGQSKLTDDDARFILDSKGVIPQRQLARRFHISQAAVSAIHCRITWTHLG